MGKFCVSGYAFSDYLKNDETTELHKLYRANGFKQFHYMNAAYREHTNRCEFYSYWTRIFYYEIRETYTVLKVSPFIWNTDRYINSATTNRQANKWLFENGFDTSVQELREIYRVSVNAPVNKYTPIYENVPIHYIRDDYNYILPVFIQAQQTMNPREIGAYEVDIHNPKAPELALYHNTYFLLAKDRTYDYIL